MRSQPQKLGLAALIVVMLLVCAAALAPSRFPPAAQAASPNLAPGFGVMVLPLHISGQYTTTTAAVAKFNMPMPCDMLGVGASARAMGTTAMTVDVQSGGTTILSAPITMAAGTYGEATISTAAIPDENAITVDINAPSGTSTINDVTVVLTCARK